MPELKLPGGVWSLELSSLKSVTHNLPLTVSELLGPGVWVFDVQINTGLLIPSLSPGKVDD